MNSEMTLSDEEAKRQKQKQRRCKIIVEAMKQLAASGLNKGTAGNVSMRFGDGMLITPSGIKPEFLNESMIVELDAEGNKVGSGRAPSSEWQMHWALYQQRRSTNAVVHCHSRYATILACARKPIPAFHYMVSVTGKDHVPCAPYATFGSEELAQSVCDTMGDGYACLMENHGQIVAAANMDRAIWITEEVEEQASVYWGAEAIGGAVNLTDEEMTAVNKRFASYGQ
ncbi:MAG: class II aldolase/adducin family protein [Endozoicomonas sp.]